MCHSGTRSTLLTSIREAFASSRASSPSEVFRAMLRFVAKNFDLRKLNLEVDAREALGLSEDAAAGAYGGDEVD